jgi:hypothetical protein
MSGFLFTRSTTQSETLTSSVESIVPRSDSTTINSFGLSQASLSQEEGIKALEKKLAPKKSGLKGQDLTRHRAVLQFLFYQRSEKRQREGNSVLSGKGKMTRMEMAMQVARCFSRGKFYAEKLISWERKWLASQDIPLGKQSCFVKTESWFNDEGVMLAARKYIARAGECKLLLRHCLINI